MALDINVASIGGTATPAATGLPVDVVGGAVDVFYEVDAGLRTLAPLSWSPEVSNDARLRIANDQLVLEWSFNSTTQNTAKFKHGFTTMTANQSTSAGFLLLNANSSTASGNGCSLQSYATTPLFNTCMVYHALLFNFTAVPITNQVWEHGHFFTTVPTPITPADGVFIRTTTSGVYGILAYSGVETQSSLLIPFSELPSLVGSNALVVIGTSNRSVEFWIDKQDGAGIKLMGHIDVPVGNASPFLSYALPCFATQMRNAGVVAASGQMQVKIGPGSVTYSGLNMSRPWYDQLAGTGNCLFQGQDGGTMGSTSAAPNATAATTVTGATLAQSTSLKTGLGGEVGITATVPGVDGSVWAWQNPTGSTTAPPKVAYITSIRIDSMNIGATVATTPTALQWAVDIGSTALPLNTAESASFATWAAATGKAGRRIVLGQQSWIVGALVGAPAENIWMTFSPAIPVNPGEYFKVVAKFTQGTATASQVIWSTCGIHGVNI